MKAREHPRSHQSRRRLIASACSLLLLVTIVVPAAATPDDHGGTGKIVLCHATDSAENPYVVITVDPASVFQQGHDGHTGPVYDPAVHDQTNRGWGDIIPPFDYRYEHGSTLHEGTYPGLNWPAGEAIWAADCTVPPPPPPPVDDLVTTLTVSKVVDGETDASGFAFRIDDVEGPSSFTLDDGEQYTVTWRTPGDDETSTISVALTETDPQGADEVTASLGGEPLPSVEGSWELTLDIGEDHTVTVTNRFEADEPPVEPPPVEPPPVEPPPVEPPPAVTPVPGISLTKLADVEPDEDGVVGVVYDAQAPGEITYTYEITNTGDTTLDELTLDDDVLGAVTLSETSLEPGARTTATAVHELTAADATAGSVTNTATVVGTAPDGTTVSDEDTVRVEVTVVLGEVIEAEEVDEVEVTVVLGVTEVAAASLPRTGVPAGVLAAIGAVLLALGAATLRGSAAAPARRGGAARR